MTIPNAGARIEQRVQLPTLTHFHSEFASSSDLARYDKIHSNERAVSQEVVYLNQLQVDGYIPANIAVLLKNNLHDSPFITHTTRSVLYDLKQRGEIGETCFNFLHEKLNAQEFTCVFRTLYILMLYRKASELHQTHSPDPAFRFQSLECYSDTLIQAPSHILASEEIKLERAHRCRFLKEYFTQMRNRSDCSPATAQQIIALMQSLQSLNFSQFRVESLLLFSKMNPSSELERICSKELHSHLSGYFAEEFFNQTYLRLKTESYYKQCLLRVSHLRLDLEAASGSDLLSLIEKCKKSYNGCIHLLGDSKNMPACSETRFNAISGKMRTEWQAIDQAASRARQQNGHLFCACQSQSSPDQNRLALWPCHTHSLIELKPTQPVTSDQLQSQGISPSLFQENQKKTVAIFGAKWGGGHMEVSRGIANNLSSLGYHPFTIDLPELMISEDSVRNFFLTRWLGASWSSVTLYEGLLKEKAFAFINFILWLQAKLFSAFGYKESELKLVMDYLLKLNPDSVVTTCRVHHEAIIEACKILGIPYIHVATDVDTSLNSREKPTEFKHFKIAVPFDAPESITPILTTTTPEQRFVSGPPVRHAFTAPRTLENVQQLKSKWGIDSNKKVVVISNGKNGAFSPYAEILAKQYAGSTQIPIHVVVICGQANQDFKRHLEQNVALATKLPMTIDLAYNEEQMEELMSMASYGGALIGKAGGSTVFETFARGTRILIDDVRPRLFSHGFHHFWITMVERFLRMLGFEKQMPWEKINMDFAKKHGLADAFEEESEFLPKLNKLLDNNGNPVIPPIEIKNIERTIPAMLRDMMNKAETDLDAVRARAAHRNL